MSSSISVPSSDPTLADLLNQIKKDIFMSLNCHAIATVQSFSSSAQTIQATINYSKASLVLQDGVYVQVPQLYPVLLDVPVLILGGGNWSLTFPISVGDQCLILFNDRDIDNWFAGSPVQPPNTPRLHSFSDGIAIVGLHNANNQIANYDTTRACLKNGTTEIGVGSSLIRLANSVTTLNTALQLLITGILGMTAGGNPMVDATGKISQASTKLGDLLE